VPVISAHFRSLFQFRLGIWLKGRKGFVGPLEIGFAGKEKAPIEGLGGDKSSQKL